MGWGGVLWRAGIGLADGWGSMESETLDEGDIWCVGRGNDKLGRKLGWEE